MEWKNGEDYCWGDEVKFRLIVFFCGRDGIFCWRKVCLGLFERDGNWS